MLEAILDNLNNYFEVAINRGGFTIASGALDVNFLLPEQYFRIRGSVLNDGLYQYPVSGLTDETFVGEIWALAIPKEVLKLADEIGTWTEEHPITDKTSESFGGYSYTKGTNGKGSPLGWQDIFRDRLSRWRCL